MGVTSLQGLLEAVGGEAPVTALVRGANEATWTIAIAGPARVAVTWIEAAHVARFALELPPVGAERAAELHELLLRYSYINAGSGDLRAGLDERGRAHLLVEAPLSALDEGSLGRLLELLAAQYQSWAQVIADQRPPSEIGQDRLPPADAIRV